MIIHDEDEDKKQYHRVKTAEQRNNWRALGCVQLSHNIPLNLRVLMRGMVGCINAAHCLNLLREGDQEAMMIMADTRPRYDVKHEDVAVLEDRSAEIDERCKAMNEMLKEARWHRAQGKANMSVPVLGTYHYAVEWCIVTYLKGYYDITTHMVKHGTYVLPMDFEFKNMREGAPSVL